MAGGQFPPGVAVFRGPVEDVLRDNGLEILDVAEAGLGFGKMEQLAEDQAVAVGVVVIEGDDVGAVPLRQAVAGLQHLRMQEIVAVQEDEIPSLRQLDGLVAGDADAGVRQMQHPEAAIFRRETVHQRARSVRAPVVGADGFPVREGLGLQAPQTAVQEPDRVEGGDDDGEIGHRRTNVR